MTIAVDLGCKARKQKNKNKICYGSHVVQLVRLEPAAPWSPVKHSITEPLRSISTHLNVFKGLSPATHLDSGKKPVHDRNGKSQCFRGEVESSIKEN